MIEWQTVLARLSLAALLGGLIGLERQRLDWAAGLRTHMIVCIGSALMMIVSAFGFQDVVGHPGIGLDPSRIVAQVVSGIGFIGAGTILFLKNKVIKGLTTAAGLWTVAGIGLAAGGGLYFAAAIATLLVLIILFVIKPYEAKLIPRNRRKDLQIEVNLNKIGLRDIEALMKKYNLAYSHISVRPGSNSETNHIHIHLSRQAEQTQLLALTEDLFKTNGVTEAHITTN